MSRRLLIRRMMWLLAIGYPLGTAGTVLAMIRVDPHSIFDRYYLLVTVLILPPTLVLVAIWLGARRGAPGWGWTLALALWVACVGYTHYTFITLAAGGV